MENTSGHGPAATVPAEIDKWNWGAFLLNWIWGIGNNTFIALLVFIPFVNVVMPFVLGAKGSSWAWRNKKWDSVEQFKAVQRSWAKWALIVYALIIAFMVAVFFMIAAAIKNTDAYKLAVNTLEASPEAAEMLGKPVKTGIPGGSVQMSGPRGTASLSFSAEGPKGKGTVYFEAVKDLGQWKIERAVLEEEGSGRRIDLAR